MRKFEKKYSDLEKSKSGAKKIGLCRIRRDCCVESNLLSIGNSTRNSRGEKKYSCQCYCVQHNAMKVRNGDDKWKTHQLTRNLRFSDRWVIGFLRRLKLRRRRVTTTLKVLPPIEEVKTTMNVIPQVK